MALSPVDLSSIAAGTGGFAIHGAAAYGIAGITIAGVGDINGDGFADLLIGSYPGAATAKVDSYAGAAFVVFGTGAASPASISLADIAAGTGGFAITGEEAGDRAGRSVSAAGDVNGDGLADLLVAARAADGAGNAKAGAGGAYVVFGRTTQFPTTLGLAGIAAGTGGFAVHGEDAGDNAGFAVATAGDINGDGFADLVIGAPFADGPANATDQAGGAYVVFGAAGNLGPQIDLARVASGTGGFVLHGEPRALDRAGLAVAPAGDINGDGFGDFAIGAATADGAGDAKDYAGDSYVVFGRAAGFGAAIDLAAVAQGNGGFVIHGEDALDESGFALSTAGDFNGDGFGDLIVSAPYGGAAGNLKEKAGGAYLVFGAAGGFAAGIDLGTVAAGTGGFVLHGADAGDIAGVSVASAGDFNGDGFDDLLIGAYKADGAGNALAEAGDTYLVFGTATPSATGIDLAAIAAGTGGFVLHGAEARDQTGLSVAAAGDVNGDGFADLLIGTFGGDGAGNAANYGGDAYVVFGFDATGAVTHPGSPLGETLTGTGAADTMQGGQGGDTLTGGGGRDVLLGGAGDDVLRIADPGFCRVVGGTGTDTLALDGAGFALALAGIADSALRGIERIDLAGSGDNSLTVSRLEVLNLSDTSNTLRVDGDAGDTLLLADAGWSRTAGAAGTTTLANGAATIELAEQVEIAGAAIVTIAATGVSLAEGNAGTAAFSFTATRTGDLAAAALAGYSVAGSGTRPADAADFAGGILPEGNISFAAGAATASLIISVAGDTLVEAAETFAVRLASRSVGLIADTASAIGTIQPDDAIGDLAVVNGTTNAPVAATPGFYAGPVGGLEKELVLLTAENVNVSVAGANWFIHTGSGTDAIAVAGGINVLDGGTGSNFLSGGPGQDTFFVDARGATEATWSTVLGFNPGDAATLWGIAAGAFSVAWIDGLGAAGATGLTLQATAAGRPTISLTMAGYTRADLDQGRLGVLFGTEPISGSDYTYIYAA